VSTGASVGSIYSQMILDTSQYEKALRDIVGMTKKGSDQSASSFDKTGKAVDSTTSKIKEQNRSVGSLSSSLQALGGILGSAAIVGGLKSMTMEAGKMETVNTSFKVMLGSATKAKQVLGELNQFSIATPFTPTQVFQAGKALTAFGVEAKQLIPTLRMVGDVASGTGKDFNELSVIYGKAFIAGNIYAEDLNQLMEAGVPIISELSKVMGVQEGQVKKLASEGKIGFKQLELAFQNMTQEGGRFFGMMDEQSKTLEGSISTMQGNFTDLTVVIGEQLLPIVKSLVQSLSGIIKGITEFAKENPVLFGTIVKLTVGLAALLAVLIGGAGLKVAVMQLIPLLNTLGITAVTTGGKIALAFGPAGAAFLAISGIILLISQAQDRLNRLNAQRVDSTTRAIQGMTEAQRRSATAALAFFQLTDVQVNKQSADYANLKRTIEGVGLTMDQVGRTFGQRGREIFKVDSASIRNIINNLQQTANENPIRVPVVGGGGGAANGAVTEQDNAVLGSYNQRLAELNSNLAQAVLVRDEFTVMGSDAWEDANKDVVKYNAELKKLTSTIDAGMFHNLLLAFEDLGIEFSKTTKAMLGGISKLAEGGMQYLQTMAQAASQRFQNVQQQVGSMNEWGAALLDKQIEATLKSYDIELQALQDQKDRLIAIEEEYQLRRDEIRNAEIQKIKDRIEQEYQIEAENAQLKYEEELLLQETKMLDEEQRKINQQRLEEEHLQGLNDLRNRFDDMTKEEIAALTESMRAEDQTRSTNHKTELEAIALKEKEIEDKKVAEKEANDKKKAELEKKLKLYEWAMGKQAFEASKRLQMATIQMQMAQGLISAVTAGAMLAATVPFIGWILGPALAVMLSGMVLSAGMSSLQAVGSSQYQPPPAAAFAEGGMITGGIPNQDSVNVRMMPGELVVPTKNFEEVVGAVRNERQGNGGIVISGNNFYGIDSPETFVDKVSEMLYDRTRGAVAAFI
jgi:tape measure domain-containing protein